MPVVVAEQFGSPILHSGENSGGVRAYIAQGSADEAEVEAAVLVEAPTSYNGQPIRGIRTEPLANLVWHAEVTYGNINSDSAGPPDTGATLTSFEVGVTNQRLTHSLATIASYAAPGKTAPNFKNAIGVNGEEIEGVDVVIPVATVKKAAYLENATVNASYINSMLNMVAKVNSDAVIDRAIGEVLFMGASGAQRAAGDWEISYTFAVSPNRTGITIGDITSIEKKGWDYLWVRYESGVDASAIVKVPLAAYVERVYPTVAMSGLPGLS